MIIGGKEVNNFNSRVLIIAEAGINHDGKLEQAIELVDIAKASGSDVVKFQLFKAEKMYSKKAGLYKTASGKDVDINSTLKSVELQETWLPILIDYCRKKEMGFLCTVCDKEGADVLVGQGVDSFKLASYGITHLPLIRHIARYNIPVIISTAGAYLSDVDIAVREIEMQGNNKIGIMHCIAKYPTPLNECNLDVIKSYKLAFPNAVIGYSDHTEEPIDAPVCAVLNGAKIIEKHFTLDKSLPGADHSFAVDAFGLKMMCDAIRECEVKMEKGMGCDRNSALCGTSRKTVLEVEESLRKYAYRTIIATSKIEKGEKLSEKNIAVLRPGNQERGLEPCMYELLIDGVIATKDIEEGEAVKWENIVQK